MKSSLFVISILDFMAVSVPMPQAVTVDLELIHLGDNAQEGMENTFNLYRNITSQSFDSFADNKDPVFDGLVKKLPQLRSKTPMKGLLKLGDNTIPFVLDATDLPKTGLDLLYIDFNLNNDLSDDEPIKAVKKKSVSKDYASRYFPAFKVRYRINEDHTVRGQNRIGALG